MAGATTADTLAPQGSVTSCRRCLGLGDVTKGEGKDVRGPAGTLAGGVSWDRRKHGACCCENPETWIPPRTPTLCRSAPQTSGSITLRASSREQRHGKRLALWFFFFCRLGPQAECARLTPLSLPHRTPHPRAARAEVRSAVAGSSFEWAGYRLGSGPGRSFLPQRHFLIGRAEDVPAPPVTVAFSLVSPVLLEASLTTGLRMSGIPPTSVYQCRGDAQRSIWLIYRSQTSLKLSTGPSPDVRPWYISVGGNTNI